MPSISGISDNKDGKSDSKDDESDDSDEEDESSANYTGSNTMKESSYKNKEEKGKKIGSARRQWGNMDDDRLRNSDAKLNAPNVDSDSEKMVDNDAPNLEGTI